MPATATDYYFDTVRPDKSSAQPVYLQIAESITGLIKGGTLPVGFVLPPERELCQRFGVSRMTLRQAVGILEREGLVESHRGRGTFVAPNRLRKQQQELRSFTEEIRSRGGKPQSQLLSFKLAEPTPSAREIFQLDDSGRVYEIRRLRLKDDVPLAVEVAQIAQRFCPRLERFDLQRNSLYQILEDSYGLRLGHSMEEISAQLPDAQNRKLLGISKHDAVLVIDRTTYTDHGDALEVTKSTYRGDLYSAVVHSVRKQKGNSTNRK